MGPDKSEEKKIWLANKHEVFEHLDRKNSILIEAVMEAKKNAWRKEVE